MDDRLSKPVFDLPRWKQKWQDREFDDEFAELHVHYLYAQHTAFRGDSTIEDATNADDRLLARVAWDACEAEARRWLEHGLDVPGPSGIAERMRRPLERWGLKAYLGKHTKPRANRHDGRDLFFYQGVRILQIIQETDDQRPLTRLIAKVYNRLKPPEAEAVNAETVRNGFKKFRAYENG